MRAQDFSQDQNGVFQVYAQNNVKNVRPTMPEFETRGFMVMKLQT